ncbi:MAG: hypothetical protein LCH89_02445 [Proteobacteria bacterium]|nr:hypothetical protein [Pseudomonadota bacterium]
MSSTDWLSLASLLSTVVLVAITGWYAWITKHILDANKLMVAAVDAQQYAAMRPYIQVSTTVGIGTPLIYLQIENMGKSSAKNLRLSIDRDFFRFDKRSDETNLRKSPAFSGVIKNFGPGFKLKFQLGVASKILGGNSDLSPREFDISAEYDTGRERVKEHNVIDLSPYLFSSLDEDPVAEQLKKLNSNLPGLLKSR